MTWYKYKAQLPRDMRRSSTYVHVVILAFLQAEYGSHDQSNVGSVQSRQMEVGHSRFLHRPRETPAGVDVHTELAQFGSRLTQHLINTLREVSLTGVSVGQSHEVNIGVQGVPKEQGRHAGDITQAIFAANLRHSLLSFIV